jgi:hypothetical protein
MEKALLFIVLAPVAIAGIVANLPLIIGGAIIGGIIMLCNND